MDQVYSVQHKSLLPLTLLEQIITHYPSHYHVTDGWAHHCLSVDLYHLIACMNPLSFVRWRLRSETETDIINQLK